MESGRETSHGWCETRNTRRAMPPRLITPRQVTRMNPMLLSILVGGLVIAMVVMLYLAFRREDEGTASERLDQLVGRNSRKESSADMLLKQALQEVDKKTILDRLTPEFFNLTKMFEQADCNIKPSALFGISLGAGGGRGSAVACGW